MLLCKPQVAAASSTRGPTFIGDCTQADTPSRNCAIRGVIIE